MEVNDELDEELATFQKSLMPLLKRIAQQNYLEYLVYAEQSLKMLKGVYESQNPNARIMPANLDNKQHVFE